MAVTIDGTNGITNVNGSATTPAETGTDTDTGIYYGTNTVSLATGGTQRFTIDSSGNVGIGTSSPAVPLAVYKTSDSAINIQNSTSGVTNVDGLQVLLSGSNGYLWNYENGPVIFGTNNTDRMRIDSSGNVGIGTSSPTSISGFTSVTVNNATTGGLIDVQCNGATVGRLYANSNVAYLYNQSSNPLVFGTGGLEKMRIDSSGNVAIGTTATAYGVSGSTPHKQTIWFDPASNYDGLFIACTASSGTAALFFSNTSGSPNQAGSISVSGATASYNSGSDYRMKENVKPMTGALEAVAKLKPVTFDWKDQFVGARKQGQGFLAHELAEVVPDCVSGVKDEVDANGRPKYQAVDTSFLVATLTAAIQEQQQQIDALKAEFDAYKAAHP